MSSSPQASGRWEPQMLLMLRVGRDLSWAQGQRRLYSKGGSEQLGLDRLKP